MKLPKRTSQTVSENSGAGFQPAKSPLRPPVFLWSPTRLAGWKPAPLNFHTRSQAGFSLVELLVYMSVMMALLGVGYAALYRGMDTSAALRRNGDDIVRALRAGENWRADVRAAHGQIQQTTTADGQIISLPRSRGKVSYRFVEHTVFRRVGTNPWTPVLKNVEASTFVSEARTNVIVWRWELELQTRAKKLTRMHPLFTFLAVPVGDSSK